MVSHDYNLWHLCGTTAAQSQVCIIIAQVCIIKDDTVTRMISHDSSRVRKSCQLQTSHRAHATTAAVEVAHWLTGQSL